MYVVILVTISESSRVKQSKASRDQNESIRPVMEYFKQELKGLRVPGGPPAGPSPEFSDARNTARWRPQSFLRHIALGQIVTLSLSSFTFRVHYFRLRHRSASVLLRLELEDSLSSLPYRSFEAIALPGRRYPLASAQSS